MHMIIVTGKLFFSDNFRGVCVYIYIYFKQANVNDFY